MNNTAQVVLLVTQMVLEHALAMQKFSAVIHKARAEGRDVTDAEMDALKAERKAAVQQWLDG